MIRFSKLILACLLHFVCVFFVVNAFIYIIPNYLLKRIINFNYLVVCLIISYYTFEFTVRKFLNERICPKGKAVLISGCDSGFGHDLAKRLDDIGFHVYATCLYPSGSGAERLKNECSTRLQILEMNVASDESVKNAFKLVEKSLENLEFWALINNAGTQKGFTIDFARVQDFKDTMEVNAFGMLRVTKTFLPLVKRFKGRIINLTSLHGRIPAPHNSPYVMSKYAASGFSDCLRLEMNEWKIPVIQVEPELYRTLLTDDEMVGTKMRLENDSVSRDLKKEYGGEYFEELKIATLRYLNVCCSTETVRVIDDLETAVCSKYPKIVYKPCRNYLMGVFVDAFELMPYNLRDLLVNVMCYLLSFPKPLKS
ncbi:D-beta-hydroxybutyrate dehydrogenase, mitochondrial isoform X2 [Parasteatoda tepidariorum]|uniref:D-beta-hydroxybutyrate dehydrogenase, mitochondrial isoform X2 n=1 Tax=Parasteatoda tepidariorum TaxID=114398 RepID=UPI0039BC3F36